jgi:hypothetical protein
MMTQQETEPRPSREATRASLLSATEAIMFEGMPSYDKKQFITLLLNNGFFETNSTLRMYAVVIARSVVISDEFVNYFYRLFLRGGYKYGERPNPPPLQIIANYEDEDEDEDEENDANAMMDAKYYL